MRRGGRPRSRATSPRRRGRRRCRPTLGRTHRGHGCRPRQALRPLLRSTSSATRPRWPSAWSPSAPTWPAPTNLGGWINKVGRLVGAASGATGSPTTRDARALARDDAAASTSSSASPRSTWSGCSASSAPPGAAAASRCCRSGRSTTRSSARALEPWSFGIYAGGQSILVGTPSGVTLAPEGGAHQSIITPSIGLGAAGLHRLGAGVRAGPRVDAARTRSSRLGRAGRRARRTSGSPPGRSTRRSPRCRATRPPRAAPAQVLAGGYRLRRADGHAAR